MCGCRFRSAAAMEYKKTRTGGGTRRSTVKCRVRPSHWTSECPATSYQPVEARCDEGWQSSSHDGRLPSLHLSNDGLKRVPSKARGGPHASSRAFCLARPTPTRKHDGGVRSSSRNYTGRCSESGFSPARSEIFAPSSPSSRHSNKLRTACPRRSKPIPIDSMISTTSRAIVAAWSLAA